MGWNDPPRVRNEAVALPVVFGCLADIRLRQRVEAALRGRVDLEWIARLEGIHDAVMSESRQVAGVLIGLRYPVRGDEIAFVREFRQAARGIPIIGYCGRAWVNDPASLCGLGAAGVDTLLFEGINDVGHAARRVVLDAISLLAADRVMREIVGVIPPSFQRFVEIVVRNPASAQRVEEVAAHLRIPRQTISRWCREQAFVKPEELLMWSRLFLVAVLLETTSKTVEAIGVEIDVSPTAIRNRLKTYSGLTPSDVRSGGLTMVLDAFSGRLSQIREGLGPRLRAARPKVSGVVGSI